MLCDNCGKREANVRYSENINGNKKTLNLCEECSQKFGINDINFNIPIDFSSFFREFMEDFKSPEFLPMFNNIKTIKCDECGYTFDDIVNTGKLGCGNCYSVFEDSLDPIIRKIQGSNRHKGRIGKVLDNKIDKKIIGKSINNNDKEKNKNSDNNNEKNGELDKISKLQEELKEAIKEEKYEEAAKLRDEIKKLSEK